MHLEEELILAGDLVPEQFFNQFQRDLPAEWIEEALCATGTATVRRRRLPAEQVVWLIIGMAMMRDRPIVDVVDKLDLALRRSGSGTEHDPRVPRHITGSQGQDGFPSRRRGWQVLLPPRCFAKPKAAREIKK